MKPIATILTAILIVSGCTAKPRSIVIFHTNDIHGHFMPEPATWRKDTALVGGVAALENSLDSLRRIHPQSLYLDAGDLMTGNPVCNLEYNSVKGGALLEMLDGLDITAMCLGNHEFDLGAEHVRQFIGASRFPILCANVRELDSDQPLTTATLQLTVNSVRIGIVGLILDNLKSVVAKANIASFVVDNAAATAQKHINELDPATDLIVMLTHMGVDNDSLLATKLHGADVIVGGHSHTRLTAPRRVNGVIIVQAGSYCKNLGVLELTIADDSVMSYSGKLVEPIYHDRIPRSHLASFADSLEGVIQARYGQVIGELAEQWKPGYYDGSKIGNWICDRLKERYMADVALVNAGGLRTTWNPGPITMLDVLEMLPFENFVTTFDATGADLYAFAVEQARAHGLRAHGAMEMSGMTITYRKSGDTVEVMNAKFNDKPIEPTKTYRIVSIDYVSVSQADRYLHFTPQNHETSTLMLSDAIMDEIKKHTGPLRADPHPRLREVP